MYLIYKVKLLKLSTLKYNMHTVIQKYKGLRSFKHGFERILVLYKSVACINVSIHLSTARNSPLLDRSTFSFTVSGLRPETVIK